MGERVERPGALIASVVFALSIALLLLNDHVLKAAWPGFVTGKLSDVAGVAMVAIGLTALLRHRGAGFGLTAIAFVLLKTVPVVAVLASPVLGGVTLTDPTDVGALLILAPLWRWVDRRQTAPLTDSARARRWWVLAAQTVAVTSAVFATSATSCAPDGLFDVRAVDGVVYARADADIWASTDGGASWRSSDVDPLGELWDATNADPACVGDRCFEVAWSPDGTNSVQVVELVDGARVGLLGFSADDRQEFFETVDPGCGDESFTSFAVTRLDDGDHIVVNMAEAGVLHGTPAGLWEWEAVGPWGLDEVAGDEFLGYRIGSKPPGAFGTSTAGRLADRIVSPIAPLVVVLSPIVLLWWARRIGRIAERNRRSAPGAVGTSIALGIVLIVIGLGAVLLAGGFGNDVPPLMAVIWVLIIGAVVLGTWLYHRRPTRTIEAPPLPPPPSDERVG